MLNKVELMGRIVRDIEIRKGSNDVSFAKFSLAVERDVKNKETGERETDWINIAASGARADFAGKYFHKGDMMVVVGRLRQNKWTDKDGNKHNDIEVVAQDIYFGGGKKENASQQNEKEQTKPESQSNDDEDEGELPF